MSKPKTAMPSSSAKGRGKPRTEKKDNKPSVASRSQNARQSLAIWEKVFVEWHPAYVLIPVVLALLTSLNTLQNGFAHDDLPQILNNPFTKDIGNVLLTFTGSVWSLFSDNIRAATDVYYRPLFNILLIVNYALFGTSAWAWHLVNVVIHSAVSLLVFVVCSEVTGRKWVALVAASLFATHPVHAESVAWISGVTDPLMALFVLPAFIFYLRYGRSGRKLLLAVASGFYFLALLSKETAMALPMLVAYYEFAHRQEGSTLKVKLRSTLAMVGIFAIPTLLYFAMRFSALDSLLVSGDLAKYPFATTLMTVPVVISKYIWLMSVPLSYSFQHYTALINSITSFPFIAAVVLLMSVTAALILTKSRDLRFAGVWFIAALAPSLVAIRLLHPVSLVQERYLYLPSIGFCLALGLGIEWLWRSSRSGVAGRVLASVLGLTIIVWWSAVIVGQNRSWRDTVTLFQHNVAANPRAPLARTALSTAYYGAGMQPQAEREAHTALDLDSSCIDAYVNLAYLARASGKLDLAIDYLHQATEVITDEPEKLGYQGILHHDLGLLYEQNKNFDLAESNLRRAIDFRPSAPNFYDLGEFYFDLGRYEQAREMYEKTLRHVPSRFFGLIHLRLGRTYDRLGQQDRARLEYQKYLELSPKGKDRSEALRRLSQP
ncbi:MAG: hypothetical protein DMF60_15570 [Acidobacteria bacterium]|nr:MAG: hypothetical protein DMF60_15570 [Acidobacteriota bacterium]